MHSLYKQNTGSNLSAYQLKNEQVNSCGMSHAYYIHLNLDLHVMIQKEPKNKILSEEARLDM